MKTITTILFLITVLSSSAQTTERYTSDSPVLTRIHNFFSYVTPARDTLYMTNCDMSGLILEIWTYPIYAEEQHPIFILTSKEEIIRKSKQELQ